MKISVIDTEGIAVRTGGTKSKKQTTVWVKKVAIIVWIDGQIDTEREYTISFPKKWNEIDNNTRKSWSYTHKIHNQRWDQPGVPYRDSLNEIMELVSGGEVWAKGKFLEDRFINNIGMYGESFCQKDFAKRSIFVNELNYLRYRNGKKIDKYDTAVYKFYKWNLSNGHHISKYAENFISNYQQGIPCHHDPINECNYFLGELLKINGYV